MAFTVTARHTGNNATTAGQTLVTDSQTPTASSLFIVAAGGVRNGQVAAYSWQPPVGGGYTYTNLQVPNTAFNWAADATFAAGGAVWRADVGGSPSAHTVTVDPHSGTETCFLGAVCFDITGHSSSTPVQSKAGGADAGTAGDSVTGTITLDSAPTAGNLIVVCWMVAGDVVGGVTSPTSNGQTFTTITNQTPANCHVSCFYRVATGAENATISTTDLGQTVGAYAVIVFEIPAAGGAPPTDFSTNPLRLQPKIIGNPFIGDIGRGPGANVTTFPRQPAIPMVLWYDAEIAAAAVGATTTPAAIATVTALPAPTVQTGATTTPTAIATVAAVPAPTVSGGSTTAPSAIATVIALPAPTVTTGSNATATPAAIATITGVGTTSLSTGETVATAVIATVAALPAPSIQTGSTTTPTAIATVTALPAPSVSVGSNATPTPTAIATVTAVGAPSLSTGEITAVTAIATVTALPAPTLHTGSTVTATAVATITALPAPAVSAGGNATITPAAIATVTTVPATTLSTGEQVTAAAITTVTALPAPTVHTGATTAPTAIATAAALPAPSISTGQRVNPATVATVAAIPAPTISLPRTVAATAITTVSTLPAPTIKFGTTVTAQAIASYSLVGAAILQTTGVDIDIDVTTGTGRYQVYTTSHRNSATTGSGIHLEVIAG